MLRSIILAPWLLLALLLGAAERDAARVDVRDAAVAATQLTTSHPQLPFLTTGGLALDATARAPAGVSAARASDTQAPFASDARIGSQQASATALRYLIYARDLLDDRSGLPLTYGTPPPHGSSC